MDDGRVALGTVAAEYVHRWFPRRRALAGFSAGLSVRLDEAYCREVAEYYERAPRLAWDAGLRWRYGRLAVESARQYRAVVGAGLRVLPWAGPSRPYRSSADLIEHVRTAGALYVQLTSHAHGPAGQAGFHPMRAKSGVVEGGVELCGNDLFRVVHDVFGHVLLGSSFGPRGEFLATYGHLHLYSADLLPVLFTEQIGQICWFYFGPHLVDGSGRLPRPGDPGYVSPAERPYPVQKVFAFPRHFLDRFLASFPGGPR